MAKGLYVHIPFCEYICYYCDFNKFLINNQPVDEYLEALDGELASYTMDQLQTVYIGGGTPTALSAAQVEKLMQIMDRHVPVSQLEEYTVEVNPGDVGEEKLSLLKAGGVDRLSIGVQTFHDSQLNSIGRGHSAEEAKETVHAARQAGFDNISIDLMFGLPGQTMKDWEETLDEAMALAPPHVSAYSLKIEKQTRFYNWWREGKIAPLPEEEEADMYELLVERLENHGLHAYEISNFARAGYGSRHNRIYWQNEEYIGVGAGAHGYTDGVRYANIKPLNHYIQAVQEKGNPVQTTHPVTRKEQIEEEMFLGLRLYEGVSTEHFYQKYGCTVKDIYPESIQEAKRKEWLTEADGRLFLTEEGKLLGNEVFALFLLDDEPENN